MTLKRANCNNRWQQYL